MKNFKGQKGVKRIHVNQHNLRDNMKDEKDRPIFTCKVGTENHYGHHVEIHGPSVLIYPDNPLSCGARAWINVQIMFICRPSYSFVGPCFNCMLRFVFVFVHPDHTPSRTHTSSRNTYHPETPHPATLHPETHNPDALHQERAYRPETHIIQKHTSPRSPSSRNTSS